MPRSVCARTYDALSTMNLDFAPYWLKTYMRMSLCALALSVNFGVALVSISKLLIVIGFLLFLKYDWMAFAQSAQSQLQYSQNRWLYLTQGLKSLRVNFKKLDSPAIVMLCVLWMSVSLIWSEADLSEWPMALIRHARILFLPLILYCIRSKKDVQWIVLSMIAGQVLIVFISYLLWLGVPFPLFNPLYPKDFGVVINGHLEQPIMTTLMVVIAWSFRKEIWPALGQGPIYLLCALGAFNVFFIMTGRTGFISMLLAITFGIYQYFKTRYTKQMAWIWLLPVIMTCVLSLLSNRFNNKVFEAVNDIALYAQGNDATSQGYRLDYWRQSLKSISESALVGHGVGSWRHEYIGHGGNEPNAPTNPHQQFLLWTVESGFVGLLLILTFYRALYKDAQRLEGAAREAMLNSFVIVVMVSLFNCPFYGAGIGEFFILIFASMSSLIKNQDLHSRPSHPSPLSTSQLKTLTWIENMGLRVVTQPLSVAVPGNEVSYAKSEGLSKLGWRQLRKTFYLQLKHQRELQCNEAQPTWTRGLWIYQRTTQIGDSLMDLAPRGLFKAHGIEMDLMTPQHLIELFEGDPCFKNIYSSFNSDQRPSYDFVIVQSMHHRSLHKKIKYFPTLPWVCIQGDYDVPDFCRSRFVTQRLCDVFNWTLTAEEFDHQAKQKLMRPSLSAESTNPDTYPLVIVLGGMDPSRIYLQWSDLLLKLHEMGFKDCVLLGTGDQALHAANQVLNDLGDRMNVQNWVNQMTLQQCSDVLSQTQLLITADGGLMHLGVASGCKRIISLFTRNIMPSYRLSVEFTKDAIQSPTHAINGIAYTQIIHRIFDNAQVP